jgi:putative ABC transport system substrate-binding protein
MRRREFIAVLGSAPLLPLIALGQDAGRSYRVGSLHMAPWDAPHHVALRNSLRRLGFVEGYNLSLDVNGYGLRREQFDEHAAELANSKVDVLYCAGDAALRAAQQATSTIPIVGVTDDMVSAGLVNSLARPESNMTGVSIFSSELDTKRQELLLELLPSVRRIAALADTATTSAGQLANLERAARKQGVAMSVHQVGKPEEIAGAIEAAKASGAEALNVLATPLLFNSRKIVYTHTMTLNMPAIYQWPEMASEGGLIAYGPSLVQVFRDHVAQILVKLLRGTKPSDVPVERPTKFQLVINLRTAKPMGIDVPPPMLMRADEVIE